MWKMYRIITKKSLLPLMLALVLIVTSLVGPKITSGGIAQAADPQTYTVNTFNDTDDDDHGNQICADKQGNCSLRAAISEVNFGEGGDTINIPQAGTYTLSVGSDIGGFNNTGDLDIARSLTINNTSGGKVIITGDDNYKQIFDIGPATDSSITVSFNGLTITGATGKEQAVYVGGAYSVTLNLTNVTITANANLGLLNDPNGIVNINNSLITDNRNGGIRNHGTMTITNSKISGNIGSPGIRNTYVTRNKRRIYGIMTINNSTITKNTTTGAGGGIRTDDKAVTTIASSYITRNQARVGAGIYIEKNITIRRSVIAGNIAVGGASYGGGIYLGDADANSSATITDTTISDNVAQGSTKKRQLGGGGIFNNNGNMSLGNVTLSGNRAHAGGGFYLGGRKDQKHDNMSLNNVTITSNRADFGGGYYMREDGYGPLHVKNTILAGNSANERGPNCYDLYQRTGTLGYNLVNSILYCRAYVDESSGGNDKVGQSAGLMPLQDNGGPTCTHALQSTSVAINAGNTCTATDQRGATRDNSCDIGAFEYNASAITNNTPLECDFGNDAPKAIDDKYSTPFQTPLIVTAPGVLGNDTDDEGDTLTAKVDVAPHNGAAIMLPDGSFVYTPDNGFTGEDNFTYIAEDEFAESNVATVRITVTSPQPLAQDDTYTILPGQQLSVPASRGVLLNDIDPLDGSPLTATDSSQPTNGQVILNSDGSFTYTPNPGYDGIDTFTYKATDGVTKSDLATVTIVVSQTRPTSRNDAYATAKNTPITVNATNGVLANDTDPNKDGLVAAVDTSPPASEGTLALKRDGSFTFTPQPNFVGTSTFTYHASDGTKNSNISRVSIVVSSSVPVAVNDKYTTPVNTLLTVPAPGFLGNDIDPGGNKKTWTATVVSKTTNGTLTSSGDGSFSYTPKPGFTGSDTFTYTASNGTDITNRATVTIVVANTTSGGPIAVDNKYETRVDQILIIDAKTGILSNDTGSNLTPIIVQNVSKGNLSLANDGSFSYQPNKGYAGVDRFTYKVNDGTNDSNIATVTITIGDIPTAADDAYPTQADQLLTVSAATGVLSNDNDPAKGKMTAKLVQNVTNGTLTLNPDGGFTYQPNASFVGQDTFTYMANNGQVDSNVATVTITVTGDPRGTLAFLSPVNGSTVSDLPIYSWAHVSTANSYDLGVVTASGAPMGHAIGLSASDYCVDDTCSINLAVEKNQGWLRDGAYIAFVRISGTNDWKVTNFVLDAVAPTLPSNLDVPEPNSFRSTINWTLDQNSARAYWFNLVIFTAGQNPTRMVNTWVSRMEACGNAMTCSIPLKDTLSNYNYNLYMSSWGPGGLSTGSQGGGYEGWIGPVSFTINVAAPTLPSNLDVPEPNSSRPIISWALDQNSARAYWFNLVVFTDDQNPTSMVNTWVSRVEACGNAMTCSIPLPQDILSNYNYNLYMSSWGPGGLSTGSQGGGYEGWIGPVSFTINAPKPGTIAGLSTTLDQAKGKVYFGWEHQPGVTWYQFWVGQVSSTSVDAKETGWLLSYDLKCEDDELCVYEVNSTLLPHAASPYEWYVQGWSPGGLTVGTVPRTGFSEGSFTP